MVETAAPMTPALAAVAAPAGAKPAQQKQLALNMAFYEGVYGQALSSAERLLAKEGKVPDPRDLIRVADTLFTQFCDDQIEVQREKSRQAHLDKQLSPLMNMLSQKGLI
jgi:hypothetical protein